ncbi:MAG: GyrI-like domain-containing protein [Patescibacteria group bacterium]|nr:GyrI-like domain-containing protein [Patescibacteria group bacterium]
MAKVDYKQQFKHLYSGRVDRPVVVQVPKMNFISINGRGDPNTSQAYHDAIQTLYPVAYAIKFTSKLSYGHDFSVMPLEGLWWTEDMADFDPQDKSNWLWTAMIMQPDVVTEELFNQAVQKVAEKHAPASLAKLRFTAYDEGRAAQVLYVGPYAAEGPTIQNLHSFIKQQGGRLDETTKHHHEIYLGDPRRSDPAKLKSIIRQPF